MPPRPKCSMMYVNDRIGNRTCPRHAVYVVVASGKGGFACGLHLTWAVNRVDRGQGVTVKRLKKTVPD